MTALETSAEDLWMEWRRAGVSATDVAKASSGRYGGMYAVVAHKLGLLPPVEINDRMLRGQRLETRITTATEQLLGLHIVGEQHQAEHPDQPLWRATLDGLAAHTPTPELHQCAGVVEIKTRGRSVTPAWDYWAPQVQWQMFVARMPQAWLAEVVVDDDNETILTLRLHHLTADPLEHAHLERLAIQIIEHVDDGTLPEPSATALDTVKTVWAVADTDADTVNLDGIADLVERHTEIKAAVKAVTDEQAELEARIRHTLGAATRGATGDWTVSLSKPRMALTDEAELQLLAEHPEWGRLTLDRDLADPKTIDQARKPVGARTLRITRKKTR